MHTAGQRFNYIVTYALSIATLLAAAASSTEIFVRPDPKVDFKLVRVERLARHDVGVEEAVIAFDLHADLRSCFSWNTKQLFVYVQVSFLSAGGSDSNSIVVWDKVLRSRDDALLDMKRTRNEYRLYDRDGASIKGNTVNVTVSWNVMPKVGKLYHDSRTFPGIKMPNEYIMTTNPIR